MNIARPESKQPIPQNAQCVFRGKLFDVYQWEQKLFDGSTAIFEKLKRPDTVVVFPVLPDGRILLTQQEQPGKKPFIGTTGGRVDEGEDVLSAAKRELLEESGYQASDFVLWDARQPTSKIEWAVYTFIAKGVEKVGELHLDGGERIVLQPVTFDEFVEMVTRKEFEEKEIVTKILEAKLDPRKMDQLRQLFTP